MLNGKDWEGKSRKCRAKFLAYASVSKDSRNPDHEWPSQPSIKPRHVYVISRIVSFSQPGREMYPVDWNLDDITEIEEPVFLPNGVGRGTGFYPSGNPKLMKPFRELVRRLKVQIFNNTT